MLMNEVNQTQVLLTKATAFNLNDIITLKNLLMTPSHSRMQSHRSAPKGSRIATECQFESQNPHSKI